MIQFAYSNDNLCDICYTVVAWVQSSWVKSLSVCNTRRNFIKALVFSTFFQNPAKRDPCMEWPIFSEAGTSINTLRSVRQLNSIVLKILERKSYQLVSNAFQWNQDSWLFVGEGATDSDLIAQISWFESAPLGIRRPCCRKLHLCCVNAQRMLLHTGQNWIWATVLVFFRPIIDHWIPNQNIATFGHARAIYSIQPLTYLFWCKEFQYFCCRISKCRSSFENWRSEVIGDKANSGKSPEHEDSCIHVL